MRCERKRERERENEPGMKRVPTAKKIPKKD